MQSFKKLALLLKLKMCPCVILTESQGKENNVLKNIVMKTIFNFISGFMLLLICCSGYTSIAATSEAGSTAANAGTKITVVSSPELTPLANSWSEAYAKIQPGFQVKVVERAEGQPAVAGQLQLVSEKAAEVTGDFQMKMVVGRDAIVPIMHSGNPHSEFILQKGMTADMFGGILSGKLNQDWSSILDLDGKAPLKVFLPEEQSIRSSIAGYVRLNDNEILSAILPGPEEVIAAVQRDPNAIGFCRLGDVADMENNVFVSNIRLLPIDKNRNGRMDYFENIYSDPGKFIRGVWTGKYPSALCENLYLVSETLPEEASTLAFLTWINSDGQDMLQASGYSALAGIERNANREALTLPSGIPASSPAPASPALWIILIASSIILAVAYFIYYMQKQIKSTPLSTEPIRVANSLNESVIQAPAGLYFDKTHTWAIMEANGRVRVGVDDFLQRLTGTITRIKMKEPGEKVRKGEKILTLVRDGKQLEIYAPVTGTIQEYNKALLADSSLLNSSPFGEGWVYAIEPANWLKEIRFMFMGEKYREWLTNEFARLRDFFAASVQSNTLAYNQVILQDGGEIHDQVLADLEPEVWEDFQTNFLDIYR